MARPASRKSVRSFSRSFCARRPANPARAKRWDTAKTNSRRGYSDRPCDYRDNVTRSAGLRLTSPSRQVVEQAMAEDSSKELYEFFQKMWNPMSFPIPGMFQPTMSVEEVQKKIRELDAVENWLKMNLTFVQMTVKTLEMQKSALETIQESAKQVAPDKKPKPSK